MAQHQMKSIVTVVSDDDDDDPIDKNPITTVDRIPKNDTIFNRAYDLHSIITSEIMQDFLIVCFTSKSDFSTDDFDHFIDQLKEISARVESFTDSNQCVDFLTDVTHKKILIIMYDCRDTALVSLFGDSPQVCSIYMFETPTNPNRLVRDKIRKFKGMHHDIEEICQSLRKDMHRQWFDSTPLSIISASSPGDLNDLDPSFMYSQLLQEVIVEMKYDVGKARRDFVVYCRQRFSPLDCPPDKLDEFEENYELHSPIWWYTKESFIYSNLNRALRTQDTELIMKMGFYIQDFYREAEQRRSQSKIDSKIIVYRGQGLSDQDFEKLRRSKGGLLSFNNFLSTSRDLDIAKIFAEDVRDNTNLFAILFEMEIDPFVSSSTFLSLHDLTRFAEEKEILFLMHSIFRIVDLTEIDERLWKVNLTLTDENDQELNRITHYLRDEIRSVDGWDRMALLMQRLGKFDKALEIQTSTLETTIVDDQEGLDLARANMTFITGVSHLGMGKYSSALSNFEEALEIIRPHLPANHFIVAYIYMLIGTAQRQMGDYTLALHTLEKALEILQQSSSYSQAIMAYAHNNIGLVYHAMGNSQIALSHFEKTSDAQRSYLPRYHPDLIYSCNNIAMSHQSMGNYSKALEYYRETLMIQQKSLPIDHPQLAATYCNIALIHYQLYDYPSSLEYCEKALKNRQKSCTADHPDLIVIYQNMGLANQGMNNIFAAFSNFEKALEIHQKSFPDDHPTRAILSYYIGTTHHLIGDHSAALFHLEKALEFQKKFSLMDHPNLALIYVSIGTIQFALENYPLALSYYEKALTIQQKTLPPHHPDLAKTYYNIGQTQARLGNYLPCLSYWKNATQTQQALLSHNQSLTDRSSDSTSADTQHLQHHSATMDDMTRVFEAAQTLFSTSSQSTTLEETAELCGSAANVFVDIEHALHFQPNSVLLDRQMFSSSAHHTSAGNQLLDDASMIFTSCRKLCTKAKEKLQASAANKTDNDDDTDDNSSIFDDLSSIVLHFQRLVDAQQIPPVAAVTGYSNMVEAFCAMDQYENALVCFENALKKLISSVSANDQLVAKTHDNMATALDGLDRVEEAIYSAEQAVNTASSALGPDHPETVAYGSHRDQLMRKLQFL